MANWRERPSEAPADAQSALAVFDEPISVSRLVLRYAVTGLVALVVVAVATTLVSRSLGTQAAIEDAVRITSLAAGVAVEPMLDDGVLTGDPAVLTALDRVVQEEVLRGSLIRVKIWNPDGTILYSDEERLIGDRYELAADELASLQTGEPEAEISDLSEPENRFEEQAVQLLEVYQPVTTTGGNVLLFEAYFTYAGVAEAGRNVWLRFAPYSLGALVLLELLQVPLALSLARRLRRTQHQREHLLRRAIEATEEERRRIASDLHDGVVQDLAGVAFSLGGMARESAQDGREAAEVREAADRVRDSVRQLRSLIVEIYPQNLYEEGLEAALSDLLARLEPRGIHTSLIINAPVQELAVGTTQLLYRAAQEGLRNVVAHADASSVAVSLTANGATTTLEIADDGRGLDGEVVPEKPGHVGLRALAGLADDMGATLSVRSTPGKGTVLALEVPTR
ncbi:MAG: sensor histidine kinase [Actinomycetota bacterium]|nr:sensor histidine kinase [Actinomycetota bacterium]